VHRSRVLGQGEIEGLGALALGVRDETAEDACGLVRIPDQRHLLAVWLVGEPLAGGSADEVVIELEPATIPQIPRGQVVVFDPGTDETSTQRADRFVGRRGEPPPVGLERRTGGDRRQRIGNPAGFEPVRCIGARANLPSTERLAGFEDGGLDGGAIGEIAEALSAGHPAHAVVEGADALAGDRDAGEVKEGEVG